MLGRGGQRERHRALAEVERGWSRGGPLVGPERALLRHRRERRWNARERRRGRGASGRRRAAPRHYHVPFLRRRLRLLPGDGTRGWSVCSEACESRTYTWAVSGWRAWRISLRVGESRRKSTTLARVGKADWYCTMHARATERTCACACRCSCGAAHVAVHTMHMRCTPPQRSRWWPPSALPRAAGLAWRSPPRASTAARRGGTRSTAGGLQTAWTP